MNLKNYKKIKIIESVDDYINSYKETSDGVEFTLIILLSIMAIVYFIFNMDLFYCEADAYMKPINDKNLISGLIDKNIYMQDIIVVNDIYTVDRLYNTNINGEYVFFTVNESNIINGIFQPDTSMSKATELKSIYERYSDNSYSIVIKAFLGMILSMIFSVLLIAVIIHFLTISDTIKSFFTKIFLIIEYYIFKYQNALISIYENDNRPYYKSTKVVAEYEDGSMKQAFFWIC